MMKKIFAVIVAIAMLFTLAACAWEEDDPIVDNAQTNTDQPNISDEDNIIADQPLIQEPVEEPAPVMEMTVADLTAEEERMTSLLGTDKSVSLYDFTVDDTLQKITVYAYELGEDGTWHRISGAGTYFTEPTGRLALSFDLIGESITLSTQGKSETNHTTHVRDDYGTLEDELNEAGMMTITEKRQSAAKIVYGKEIPVAIQGITPNYEAASLSISDFDNPQSLLDAGYECAYAVTIIFADKK